MTRLRKFAIAALATGTVTVGSLGIVPTASALPRSCEQVQALVNAYWATGWAYYAVGAHAQAWYWWGRSDQLAAGGCVG
jgi:hypothetical protein